MIKRKVFVNCRKKFRNIQTSSENFRKIILKQQIKKLGKTNNFGNCSVKLSGNLWKVFQNSKVPKQLNYQSQGFLGFSLQTSYQKACKRPSLEVGQPSETNTAYSEEEYPPMPLNKKMRPAQMPNSLTDWHNVPLDYSALLVYKA